MRPALLRASLVVGVLALSACATTGTMTRSGSTPSTTTGSAVDAGAELQGALSRSLAARSAATVMDTTMTTPDGRTVSYTLRGRMRLDGLEAEASGVMPAGAIAGVDAPVPVRMVTYHGTIYYHYDFPNGRSVWIKVDAGGEAAAAGGGVPADAQLKALDSLEDVTRVGTENVDGVDATHYRGTMDSRSVAAMLTSLGAQDSSAVSIPIDAWVDGQGRLIREDMTFDVNGSTTTVRMHFSDWGVAVKVTPPTGAVDITDLQQNQG